MKKPVIYALSSTLFLSSCALPQKSITPKKQVKASSVNASKSMISLRQNVYEVVIPKKEDKDIKYESALPYDKLPFKDRTDKYVSIGTAFSIAPNRFVSATHVFNPHHFSIGREYFLRDIEGNVYEVGQVHRLSLKHDLIEFDLASPSKFKGFLKLGQKPDIGVQVFTVGNAQGEGIAVRGGQIASFTPEPVDGEWNYLRFSAPASPGNSGGPLLNKKGQVVGIVTMKNSEENLNYAIPVEELQKLPKNVANFEQKNISIPIMERQVSQDLKFKLALPMKYAELAQKSEVKTREFMKSFVDVFHSKFKGDIFPNTEQSKHYLRDQDYSYYPSTIHDHGRDGKWHLHIPEYKFLTLDNDRSIYFSKNDLGLNFVLSKPKNVSLEEFNQKPELILDETIQALGVTRSFAGEKIKILSYGKPQESFAFKDKLERPWSVALWRHHFSEYTNLLACTVVPEGSACMMAEVPTRSESMGLTNLILEFAHYTHLSYKGNMKQWKEFLDLPKKQLPNLFHNAKFKYQSGKEISYSVGKISNKFVPDAEMKETSILHVFVGLNPTKVSELEVHEVALRTNEEKGKPSYYSASVVFKPLDEMSTEQKEKWSNFKENKYPYNSEVFVSKDSKIVAYPIKSQARSIASESDRGHLVICDGKAVTADEVMTTSCSKFMKNLKFD
jgi:serine protease Do